MKDTTKEVDSEVYSLKNEAVSEIKGKKSFIRRLKPNKKRSLVLGIFVLLILTNSSYTALRIPGLYKTIHFNIIWSTEANTPYSTDIAPTELYICTRSSGQFGDSYREISSYPVTEVGYRLYHATARVKRFSIRESFATSLSSPPDYSDNPVVRSLRNVGNGATINLYHEGGVSIDKPNIYLYSDTQITDTVSITMPHGYATVTDPAVPLGSTISWDVSVSSEGLFYEGESIPWLFYEGSILVSPYRSKYGYSFEMKEDSISYNNNDYSFTAFREFFKMELERLGLFHQESLDFVDWWFNDSMILFPEMGSYNLYVVEDEWVENELVLSTTHDYEELRLFFVCEKGDPVDLVLPLSVPYSTEGLILHEWGVTPSY